MLITLLQELTMSALAAFSLAGEWVAGLLSAALGPPPPWVDSDGDATVWETPLQPEGLSFSSWQVPMYPP